MDASISPLGTYPEETLHQPLLPSHAETARSERRAARLTETIYALFVLAAGILLLASTV